MGASAAVTDIGDFFAGGGNVLSVDGMAVVWFGEEFACGASFAKDVEVVLDGFVRVLGCGEGEYHEGSALAFKCRSIGLT